MFKLHDDSNFHYEAIRSLALTAHYGSDLAETLAILPKIRPGNFEDWYREWHNLALRVLSTIDESKLDSYSPVTLRDVYFRVSHYFFVSDFFLHGNPSDPRGHEAFRLWRKYFDKANACLDIPGIHAKVHSSTGGFDMPLIIYQACGADATTPRPTLILGGGFDSNMEELLHAIGFPALERGYNVVLYEGPGQPTLVHEQGRGFIHDWEKAVTPIVDYLVKHKTMDLPFINTDKLGLFGYSLGGYLAARAAAFEPRLAAVICVDGVWDANDAFKVPFTAGEAALEAGDEGAFNEVFESINEQSGTGQRWIHDHLKFSFCETSGFKIFQTTAKMELASIADKIKMPCFLGDAEEDIFFKGQPPQAAKAIGSNATLFDFGSEQAAGHHCQSGAGVYLNNTIMEWFAKVVGH